MLDSEQYINDIIIIALVEDNLGDVRLIKETLFECTNLNYDLKTFNTITDFKRGFLQNKFDVILLDLNLPDSSREETIIKIREIVKYIPIIVLTNVNSETFAVQNIRNGIQDYIVKDSLDSYGLKRSIKYSIERFKLDQELRKANLIVDRLNSELRKKLSIQTEQLNLTLHKFHTLTHNIPGMVYRGKKDWSIDFISGSEKICGYSEKDFYSDRVNWINLIHPSDKMNVMEKGNQLLEAPGELTQEYRIITKDGSQKWVSDHKISFFNIDGEFIGIDGVVLDITDRINIEHELKESEEQYRFMAENIGDILSVFDDNFKLIYINETQERISGFKFEEIKGKSPSEFLHPEDIPIAVKILRKCVKTGRGSGIFRMRNNQGTYNWMEVEAITKKDSNSKIRYLMVSRDITQRKHLEEELKQSEEKYRNLFEQASMAIFILDFQGAIRDCNTAAVNLFKFSKENIFGKRFHDLSNISKKYYTKFLDSLKKLEEGKKPEFMELKLKLESGRPVWISSHPTLVKIGNERLIQTIIQDISERKKHERLKTEFVRRISHELKTPLISIKGFTDLLLELYDKNLNPKIISILDEIQSGCNRLEKTISNFLDTSYYQSKESALQIKKNNLTFLIQFTANELRGYAESRKLNISINIENDLVFYFDRKRIHELISNLLINSIKYTPPGGNIEISTVKLENEVKISIKDNGIGFTEKEKEKLFTQFGKIERYGQGWDIETDGTGLGLFLSKLIVDMHGGEIWAESGGINKGSIFSFTLPISNGQ